MNRNKDYWALLKGTMENGEDVLETAIREFQEESGLRLDTDRVKEHLWLVGTIKQRKDKIVTAYAMEVDDIDPDKCFSNMVPDEGFPEMDEYKWFTFDEIKEVVSKSNLWFYSEIIKRLEINEDY